MNTSNPPDSFLLDCVLGFPTKTPAEIDSFMNLYAREGYHSSRSSVNYQDEQGRSPLGVVATMAGRPMVDFVKMLVGPLTKLRIKDARLRTPLLLAAENDRTEIFIYLLERLSQYETGWQLTEEKDCYQRGPLHYMCQHRNVAGVRALLAVAGAPPVGAKVREDGEEEKKKKERIKVVVNARTSSGETPLFWLAQSSTFSSQEKERMEGGGNRQKERSSRDCSSIDDKNTADAVEIAELLLAAGADPQVVNAMGQKPMDVLDEGEGDDGKEGGVKNRLQALLSPERISRGRGETEKEEEEKEEQEAERKVAEKKGCENSSIAINTPFPKTAAVAPPGGMLSSFPTRGVGFDAGNSSRIGIGSGSRSGSSGGSAPKRLKIKLKAPAARAKDK